MYFLHRGSPRHGFVVPPQYRHSLETFVRDSELEADIKSACCSQFVQYRALWITPAVIREWKIPFYEVVQQPDQLLLVLLGRYNFAYSEGFSVVESKAYAGEQ